MSNRKRPAKRGPAKRPTTALVKTKRTTTPPTTALARRLPTTRLRQALEPVLDHPAGLALTSDPIMTATYVGTLTLTPEQIAALRRSVEDREIDWRPARKDGPPDIAYLSHNGYRDRLDAAFGLGGWGMVPVGAPKEKDGVVYTPFAMVVGGVPRVYAWGEQAYHPDNRQMTYGDALEGTKSNAILRCGKELGIARDLWNRDYIAALKVRVPVAKRGPGATIQQPAREPVHAGVNEQPRTPRPTDDAVITVSRVVDGKKHAGQRERLWVIIKKSGRSDTEIRMWLKAAYGIDSTSEIKRRDYEAICEAIESSKPLPMPERETGEEG